MIVIITLIAFAFLPALVVLLEKVLYFIFLWQVKEYRVDRIWSHYRFDKPFDKGEITELVLKFGLLFGLLIFLLNPAVTSVLTAAVIAYIVYVNEALHTLQRIIKKKLIRPKIKSIRNILLVLGNLSLLLLPNIVLIIWVATNFNLPLLQSFTAEPGAIFSPDIFKQVLPQTGDNLTVIPLGLLVIVLVTAFNLALDLALHPIVILNVLITEPMALIRRRRLIRSAQAKIAANKNLKIVAITGSYGKTTTKELIYQLLKYKFNVVKTPENKNTALGIAITVNSSITKDTEVFVAEMGAYTKGEIKDSTQVAPPDISIVTAVDEQHISLFGSIHNIFEAKYEIIEGLKSDGVAILNGDNAYCIHMAEKTDKRKILYFAIDSAKYAATEVDGDSNGPTDKKFPIDQNLYASGLQVSKEGISFNLRIKHDSYFIKTNLTAPHNVSNLLAAISVAIELGVPLSEIVKIINDHDFTVPYLNIKNGMNDSYIIDDGYNANPTGFAEALKYLKNFETDQKRWVFTQGFIELGAKKDEKYQELAQLISKTADGIITNDKDLAEASRKYKKLEVIEVVSDQDFVNEYTVKIKPGDVVLIEGSFPAELLNEILANI